MLETDNDLTEGTDSHGSLRVCTLRFRVLRNQWENLTKVGTENGSHGAKDIGGVGYESSLVLGGVGIDISLVLDIGVLLTQGLLLQDLDSISGDLVEACKSATSYSAKSCDLRPSTRAGPHLFMVSASSERSHVTTDL